MRVCVALVVFFWLFEVVLRQCFFFVCVSLFLFLSFGRVDFSFVSADVC